MGTTKSVADADTVSNRIVAVDAYRGFVMFLMMAEILRLPRLAEQFPHNPVWQTIGFHTQHVEWTGCSLHDLIQPSFSFLVGVALPFSIASRMARGQSFSVMLAHAVWRSFVLIGLGIFLRSVGKQQTNFTFEDTLTQIGLGYTFLFLLGFRSMRVQAAAVALIVVGYWLAFALYPRPAGDSTLFSVFLSHWDKNANLAWAFDRWFLNLFPRKQPFAYNGGGYVTLSFIPTLGTMILGLIAGGWLRLPERPALKLARLLTAGAACLTIGWLLDRLGVCPSVKRIWTPAWTLYSGGWGYLLLAGFYAALDAVGLRAWAFPFVVIGMNSIAIYCLVHLIDGFIIGSLKTHLGQEIFRRPFGERYESLLAGTAALLVFWLILFWMYRRKLFLRI